MAALPTSYSLPTLRRRTNSTRISQRAGWKGDTRKGSSFCMSSTMLFSVPLTCFKYLRLVSPLLRWRRSSSRAISGCRRAQATQPFFSQQLAALSSGSSISIPSGLPGQGSQPSTSPIGVNILWFITLVLLYAPYKRARIRAFFAEGIERLCLIVAVEALRHAEFFPWPNSALLYLSPDHHIQPRISDHF
jgi:hypothetical protein